MIRIIAPVAMVVSTVPVASLAYDMDCKLLLCMAGGFPANCADAKAYMISRITAFPPKPPVGLCAFSGGVYDNYELNYGNLGFEAEAFECPEGANIFISGQEGREGDARAFCYTSSELICEDRRGDRVCTTEYYGQSEPLTRYDYFVDLTVEPGTEAEYRTGRLRIDF